MHERHRFERELADLEGRDYWFPRFPPPPPPATIGFEFDVHYGLNSAVVTAAGKTMPANNALLTDHTDAADGFRVKRDGPRLEIATKPFKLDTAGKTEIGDTKKKIAEFAAQLAAGCDSAPESAAVAGIAGKPHPFTHPRTVVPGLPLGTAGADLAEGEGLRGVGGAAGDGHHPTFQKRRCRSWRSRAPKEKAWLWH